MSQNRPGGVLFYGTRMDALAASFPGSAVSDEGALAREFERHVAAALGLLPEKLRQVMLPGTSHLWGIYSSAVSPGTAAPRSCAGQIKR